MTTVQERLSNIEAKERKKEKTYLKIKKWVGGGEKLAEMENIMRRAGGQRGVQGLHTAMAASL